MGGQSVAMHLSARVESLEDEKRQRSLKDVIILLFHGLPSWLCILLRVGARSQGQKFRGDTRASRSARMAFSSGDSSSGELNDTRD